MSPIEPEKNLPLGPSFTQALNQRSLPLIITDPVKSGCLSVVLRLFLNRLNEPSFIINITFPSLKRVCFE